eukprot:COSAG02_NODE_205_length_29157_cov_13.424771_2_plen_182_part_00
MKLNTAFGLWSGLMGEVMLRDINPRTNDPNTQGFKAANWEQHFQANVLSYSEFVLRIGPLSEGLQSSAMADSTPFAQAFVGLAELYDRLSTCNPNTMGSLETTSPTTPYPPYDVIRRVRMLERALLKLIVAVDSRRELYPEAHLYAEQREQHERRAAFHRLLPTLFYSAAQVIPGAVSSSQ